MKITFGLDDCSHVSSLGPKMWIGCVKVGNDYEFYLMYCGGRNQTTKKRLEFHRVVNLVMQYHTKYERNNYRNFRACSRLMEEAIDRCNKLEESK